MKTGKTGGTMICLDTNYLIRSLVPKTSEAAELEAWTIAGRKMFAPAPAWFEFLCGPVTEDQVMTIRTFLTATLPFTEREAQVSAHLFNKIGRYRKHRIDAMIAATAIVSGTELATGNRLDFQPFLAHGLQLASGEE